MAQELTINPNTIQKAYRELENQGFIYSQKGKGSFVNPQHGTMDESKSDAIMKEIEKLILEALYLGGTEEELMGLLKKLNRSKGGDENRD